MNEIEELIKSYALELPAKAAEVSQSVEKAMKKLARGASPEWDDVEYLAHKLAGSSGTYGFIHLSEVCRHLEEAVSTGGLKGLAAEGALEHLTRWRLVFAEQVELAHHREAPEGTASSTVEPLRVHLASLTSRAQGAA